LILGRPGTSVRLDVLHASDGFRREEMDLLRTAGTAGPYELEVIRGVAVLRVRSMARISAEALGAELDDVRSRGVTRLLIDLRNLADTNPRSVAPAAGLFLSGPLLRLKDRAGELIESIESPGAGTAWTGSIVVLVNGATAGSAEALARLVQEDLGGTVVGETTYGLGSEGRLYEMEGGAGLVVSASVWETAAGARWNGDGVEPDETIHGRGTEYAERHQDQFDQALEFVEKPSVVRDAA
jgi:carboxyl-terminal processing protease